MGRVLVFAILALAANAANPRQLLAPEEFSELITRRGSSDNLPSASSACPQILPGFLSVAGVSYFNGQEGGCPVKNAIDTDGSCASHMTTALGLCSAYCEVRNFFHFGQEIPTSVTCRSNDTGCAITQSESVTITQTFDFNVGGDIAKRSDGSNELVARGESLAGILEASFNLGASYTYTNTKTHSVAGVQQKPTNHAADCGFFTSVPAFITSCGTLTTAEVSDQLPTGATPPTISKRKENALCNTKTQQTQANYCNTSPLLDSAGNHWTVTIFVATVCGDDTEVDGGTIGGLLPASHQDAIYLQPGVATHTVPSG